MGSGSDPRSTCPPRKHRIAEENVSSSHVDLRTTWSIHARHPWAGIIFYVAVRPDLVTDLLYSTPLNRREEATHAPRTARQQWPIFVNMGAVVHFQRIEGQRSTTSHPLDQTRRLRLPSR